MDKALEEEIETNSEKIKQSERVQKEIYADNVQKMKVLQQYEVAIEKYNADVALLFQVVRLLREFVEFDMRDLDRKIRQLEDGIITIDDGTGRLEAKVRQVRDRVESPTYLDALQRVIDKIRRLQESNSENSNTKDGLRKQVVSQEEKISKTDPKTLTIEEIQSQKGELSKIERAIDTSENVKNDHMAEYERLINEFGDLRQDMQVNYEAKIKTVQVRHDEWLEVTTISLTTSKTIIDEMVLKIEEDNPFMKRYVRKLNNAREKHSSLKNLNEDNKRNVESLSTRNMENGDDTLSFIIKLSDDQQELDMVIEDTKRSSEDLLKLLNGIKEELEESDKTSKEEILNECKQMLTIDSKKLPSLEDKLVKLEKGVDESLKTSDIALRILDQSNSEYPKIVDLDKDLKHLQKDTSQYRTDLTRISTENSSLLSKISSADLSTISMLEILTIQKQSQKIITDHSNLSTQITDALSLLKSLHQSLSTLLESLKSHLCTLYSTETSTIDKKLTSLKKFLTPTGKVSDSIQRPSSLKELLESVSLSKEDPEYSTYSVYSELVSTNLTK